MEHLKKIGILNGGEWSRKGNIKDDDEKMMLGNGEHQGRKKTVVQK